MLFRSDRLVAVIDDNDKRTEYSHDALDRNVLVRHSDGSTESRQYDPNGNILQFTQRNGTVIQNGYSPNNRLLSRVIAALSGVEGTSFEDYTYDGLGRPISFVNDMSTVSRVYDSRGLVLQEMQNGQAVRSAYDLAGNRAHLTYPGGRALEYAHDDLDRMTEITDSEDFIPLAAFRYIGSSRLQERLFQNGTRTRISYDAIARPENIQHFAHKNWNKPDQAISDPEEELFRGFQYIFDREDNQVAEIGLKKAPSEPQGYELGRGHLFRYDSAYRLTQAAQSVKDPVLSLLGQGSSKASRETVYTLDGVGNWLSVASRFGAEVDSNDEDSSNPAFHGKEFLNLFTNNDLNQVTEVFREEKPKPSLETFQYDQNGNRTLDGSFAYTLDYNSQIIRAEERGAKSSKKRVRYTYDPLGRRIKRIVWSEKAKGSREPSSKGKSSSSSDEDGDGEPPDDAEVTLYFYDGTRLIEEQDGNGQTLRSYVHGVGPTNILSMDHHGSGAHAKGPRKAQRFFYHANLLGSITDLTDSKGHVVESYRYTPYGTPSHHYDYFKTPHAPGHSRHAFKSALGNPFLFGGQRYDEAIGLYYLWLRDYDSAVGKFLQADPIGLLGGINLYGYALGNPINFIDPFGLKRESAWETLSDLWTVMTSPDLLAEGFVKAWGTPDVAGNIKNAAKAAAPVAVAAAAFVGTTALTGNPLAGEVAAGVAATFASDVLHGTSSSASDYAWNAAASVVVGRAVRSVARALFPRASPGGTPASPAAPSKSSTVSTGSTGPKSTGPLALPFKPKWTGAVQPYKKGAMAPIEHIIYRHGPNSGFKNVGKFADGTSLKQIRSMVDEAATYGKTTFQTNGRGGIVHDFGRQIGTHMDGSAASKLQIYFNEAGEIMTAFPFK